jgi:hypothetical protein
MGWDGVGMGWGWEKRREGEGEGEGRVGSGRKKGWQVGTVLFATSNKTTCT